MVSSEAAFEEVAHMQLPVLRSVFAFLLQFPLYEGKGLLHYVSKLNSLTFLFCFEDTK